MKAPIVVIFWLVGLCLSTGCQTHIPPSDMTLNRGTQLLAAGSPKSAIPFLTQTVTATPDGPEPIALLALAYALDLQPERALSEAVLVHRTKDSRPGWEFVAVGVAEMTLRRPMAAASALEHVACGPRTPITPSAQQWLALAQILAGKPELAVTTLESLAREPCMESTATLWVVLIHAYKADGAKGTLALTRCAKAVSSRSGQMALTANLTSADDQTLYDAGVAAIAQGDLPTARRLLELVQKHDAESSDACVWLALIAGAQDNWQAARMGLKDACEKGGSSSRGLANQLYSVVCALEERPEDMVQHTLAGQRMLNRAENSRQPVAQPEREGVWGSDNINMK